MAKLMLSVAVGEYDRTRALVDGSVAIDGVDPQLAGPRELGDVVICVKHTEDIREAVVHGVLHLLGMDHETDEGEMLAVQAELLGW